MKLSISLPDELAELVRAQPNASGYIAEAIRLRRDRDIARAAILRPMLTPESQARIKAALLRSTG
jgi:hypothetical protein